MNKDKYIDELEKQYNLLFDYMWSTGTVPYILFLKETKNIPIKLLKHIKSYTTRITTK